MPIQKCKGQYGSDREVSWPSPHVTPVPITSHCEEELLFRDIEQLLKEFREIDLSCENDRLVLTYVITKLIKKGSVRDEDIR